MSYCLFIPKFSRSLSGLTVVVVVIKVIMRAGKFKLLGFGVFLFVLFFFS